MLNSNNVESINKKSVYLILLQLLMLSAGFNFFKQARFFNIPTFHLLLIISILFAFWGRKKIILPKLNSLNYYIFFLVFSIPSLIIGYLFQDAFVLLVYTYCLLPFLLFTVSYQYIDHPSFNQLIKALNLSMILVVLVGWLVRLSVLPLDVFFDIQQSEFNIGYWGISYQQSSRNHDYLYPLVGLSTSAYLFKIGTRRLFCFIIICLFFISMIASLSRGAIVISIIFFILFIRLLPLNKKIYLFGTILLVAVIGFNTFKIFYDETYRDILSSIFEIKNKDSRFSNAGRLMIIENAITASLTNPLGYGINNYDAIYSKQSTFRTYSAENAYLTILVERGWLAFGCFIAMFWSFFVSFLKTKSIGLNYFLLPTIAVYFLFNFELNNAFVWLIFFILLLDSYLSKQTKVCINKN